MIPLRDNIPSRRFPVMTVGLIAVDVAVFLYEAFFLSQPERETFIYAYGMIPRDLLQVPPVLSGEVLAGLKPVITAMFLHGGWMHLIGNMLFLWVFADNVEDLLGPRRFLILFLAAGAVGNFAHALANPDSVVPTIGASGAVAGVLGAYMVNFPRARVLALVPLGFFLTTAEVPAVFFLLIWFGLQLLYGFASLGVAAATGVAWWAHVGGFLAGAFLVNLLRERRVVR